MANLVFKYGYIEKGLTTDIFTSLVFHIIGQMFSNSAAETITARLVAKVGKITPENISLLSFEKIRECGISSRKTQYIKGLADDVLANRISLTDLTELSDEEIIDRLIKIKGVGRWTAEMICEFTLGRLNVFSFDDVALKNGIQKAHGYKTL